MFPYFVFTHINLYINYFNVQQSIKAIPKDYMNMVSTENIQNIQLNWLVFCVSPMLCVTNSIIFICIIK